MGEEGAFSVVCRIGVVEKRKVGSKWQLTACDLFFFCRCPQKNYISAIFWPLLYFNTSAGFLFLAFAFQLVYIS